MKSKVYTIGQICSRFSSGKNITAKSIEETGLYPVYGGNGLRGYTSTSNFKGECSIIGRQGAYCGNVKYIDGEAYMSEHAIVAVTNNEHDNRYFSYKLGLLKLGRFSGQAAQPGLSVGMLSKLRMEMPSLSIQKKIASILSAYDSQIENNKKRIKLLEQMAENLYKEWFVRFRFPGYETAEFEGGVPKGWRIEKLKDVSSIVYGFPFNSSLFCSDASLNPVVRIRDIADKHTETYTSEKPDDKYLIHTNDVLIGMDGIFHMNIWTNDGDYLNQRVVKVTSTKPHLSNFFIFQSIFPQVKMLESIISGTTVAHLSAKDMCKMTILIPDKHTLELSFSRFESMMAMRNKLLIQNDLLSSQRDLLLPRLMSGKLSI